MSVHYATFLLIHEGGVVTDAPPIARWTIGRKLESALAFYRKKDKNAVIQQLEAQEAHSGAE